MSEKKIIAVVGATGAQGGGLVRAILADRDGGFAARAITRKPDSDAARALAALGAEVVAADTDDAASLERAFAGAYGAFCVTNFWEHLDADREGVQAAAMARATRQAGLQHVVWSTLEDTRKLVPLDDPRLPTLYGKYKVPHFDSKGQMDAVFAAEAAPTSYLLAAFYWENFIHFGMGPRAGADAGLVLAMPLGGHKLPGIAAGDIGKSAYGIFRLGPSAAGRRFGVAGDILSGEEMAAQMGGAIGRKVTFQDVPFSVYRGLGFPGAEDLGNMFEYHKLCGEAFYEQRSPKVARELDPSVQSFGQWLAANASRITIA
jgi:uncharacterized protein YbjT (DUF2867 family)